MNGLRDQWSLVVKQSEHKEMVVFVWFRTCKGLLQDSGTLKQVAWGLDVGTRKFNYICTHCGCRRPTSSARRQWAAALVAEDVEHVDHAADEPQEAITDDVRANAQGFPSGPHDTSILTEYIHHVAATERPELKLSSHVRKVQKFGRSALEIEGIVVATGLSHLISCSLDTGDMGLIFAFADKWHKETSSFHLLVGEVTITLNDVASFLHLPITGAFHTFNALHVDQAMDLLVELLKVSTQEAKDDTFQCHGAYFCLAWLRDIYRSKCDAGQWTVAARAYPLYLVGCTLFSNKSVTHVPVIFLYAFRDLGQIGSYSWGAAALVHMYENLNDASKKTVRQLVGYITLQHCWIYKYFSTVALCVADEDYHEKKPRGCCWKFGKALLVSTYHKWLDRLMSGTVCWIPYGDHRAFREFELISLFFGQIRWGQSIRRLTINGCSSLNTLHRWSFAAATMPEALAPAPTDEVCQWIAERLECLINMRIVTTRTKAYICLRIAKGVVEQWNVYVRSRQR
ncbi:Protein MAIN-LIKE 2 [Glycine soja]